MLRPQVWTRLFLHGFLHGSSRVARDVVAQTLRPLPVIQPQLAAVLWLAGDDSLIDALVLASDQQKLLPPPVGIQTEEDVKAG